MKNPESRFAKMRLSVGQPIDTAICAALFEIVNLQTKSDPLVSVKPTGRQSQRRTSMRKDLSTTPVMSRSEKRHTNAGRHRTMAAPVRESRQDGKAGGAHLDQAETDAATIAKEDCRRRSRQG